MKSFSIWLEEKEQYRKTRKMLLDRLGFNDTSLEDHAIKIRNINKNRLQQAVSSMGLADDNLDKVLNWVKMYPDSTLQELLSQLKDYEIQGDEISDLPSKTAELPAGSPKPPKQKPQLTDNPNPGMIPGMQPGATNAFS